MELIPGILFTLFFQFIGYQIWKAYKRRQITRDAYIAPAPKPRPVPRDYSDRNEP